MDPLDLRILNCADCRRVLLGDSHRHADPNEVEAAVEAFGWKRPQLPSWVDGRPYCVACATKRVMACGMWGGGAR